MRRFVCLLAWMVVLVAGHMALKAAKGTWWTVPGLHPKTPQSRAWFHGQKNKVGPETHKDTHHDTHNDTRPQGHESGPASEKDRMHGATLEDDGAQNGHTARPGAPHARKKRVKEVKPQAKNLSCHPLWNRITKNRCTT